MRNVIILGSGRSGTSMVAGVLAKSGYWMGDNVYPGNEGNPKGMFEDREINELNEDILAQVLKSPPFLARQSSPDRPKKWQRWLARIPAGTPIPSSQKIDKRINHIIEKTPFCLKDPRFSYTLPAWKPFLENTVFVCVFRDPASTATSIMKQIKIARHLKGFNITYEEALDVWELMHRHILECQRPDEPWLFLHYQQILSGESFESLEKFTDARVDAGFPDSRLHRTTPKTGVPEKLKGLYGKLCGLAKYNNGD